MWSLSAVLSARAFDVSVGCPSRRCTLAKRVTRSISRSPGTSGRGRTQFRINARQVCHSLIPIAVVRGACAGRVGSGQVKTSEVCIFSTIHAWPQRVHRTIHANHQPLSVTIWGEAGFRFCGDPVAIPWRSYEHRHCEAPVGCTSEYHPIHRGAVLGPTFPQYSLASPQTISTCLSTAPAAEFSL